MAVIFKSLRLSRLINNNLTRTRRNGNTSSGTVINNRSKWATLSLSCFWLSVLGALILSFTMISECTGMSLLDSVSPSSSSGAEHSLVSRRRRDQFSTLSHAEHLIPANYSIHEPPPPDPDGDDKSTSVDFYILIVGVRNIQEVNEELSIELNLQLYWKDTRLSHLADKRGNRFVVLNPVLIEQIWHPDIYIDHVKKIEQPKLLSTPASLRIYPDSTIRYSGRLTITMACNFDFHLFPADTQKCEIVFKSYAYSETFLRLDWREQKPAAMKSNLLLPNFKVGLGNTQNFTVATASGHYSAISFTIILRRLISFHMIQTYLPSGLFIIVSWLSFLVSPESIPGRMTLCITTLLTITAMFASVRQNIPNVSYVKALDIWMVTCIFFVFFTLLEYTVILKLKSIKHKPAPTEQKSSQEAQSQQRKQSNGNNIMIGSRHRRDKSSNTPIWMTSSEASVGGDEGPSMNGNNNSCAAPPPPAPAPPPAGSPHEHIIAKIELIMSKLIPCLFVVFNFIYWPWLIIAADYFNDEDFEKTNFAL